MRIRMPGVIIAGFPRSSEGYEDRPLDIEAMLVPRPAATFFFRLVGDALRLEGLPSGAILVVDRSLTPRAGQLVVLAEDDAFVVRRMLARESCIVQGVVTGAVVRLV